jgi:hypothetical protein
MALYESVQRYIPDSKRTQIKERIVIHATNPKQIREIMALIILIPDWEMQTDEGHASTYVQGYADWIASLTHVIPCLVV